MKVLNLMYPEESEIKFKISHFPDGQQDIILTQVDDINVEILSRFNSFQDLELIICATKALNRFGIKNVSLYIPYLLGARSDRQFVDGGTSYLVDVIAPIINSLEFESVTVIDVHSDVAPACIKNLKVIDNTKLVNYALNDLYVPNSKDDFILISPDAGALKKIYKVADAIGYKGDIITCSKSRDENGNLSKVKVQLDLGRDFVTKDGIQNRYWDNKDFIIIDDICDGGATFLNIAKEIKNQCSEQGYSNNKIYLIVTHGIFSKGLKELAQYFDGIYTTDSIRSDFDWEQKERDKTEIVKILKI